MLLKKITQGFVVQVFDTEKGRWTSQEFVAGDQTEYEAEDGEPMDCLKFTELVGGGDEPYLPFDMVQPQAESTASLAEKLREVISDTGGFVSDHMDELIGLLETAVRESLQEHDDEE